MVFHGPHYGHPLGMHSGLLHVVGVSRIDGLLFCFTFNQSNMGMNGDARGGPFNGHLFRPSHVRFVIVFYGRMGCVTGGRHVK